jgi:divalent metal cation (Fe/Co/Zn/Cd) transporter
MAGSILGIAIGLVLLQLGGPVADPIGAVAIALGLAGFARAVISRAEHADGSERRRYRR